MNHTHESEADTGRGINVYPGAWAFDGHGLPHVEGPQVLGGLTLSSTNTGHLLLARGGRAGLATKPDREQAQELVDLLPQLDVDLTLLAEESFREMLAALDFAATVEPARNELRVRATLAPELQP